MRPLLPALLALAGLAVGAAPAVAAPSDTAYFSVQLEATQYVSWTMDRSVLSTCNGSHTLHSQGLGDSLMRIGTVVRQSAVATRRQRHLSLTFAGGGPTVPVFGEVTRHGEVRHASSAPPGTKGCGTPIPMEPDCGSRRFTGDTTIGMAWTAPGQMVLVGPSSQSPAGRAATMFQNCPGVNADNMLRGPAVFGAAIQTKAAALPPKLVFGRRRHFVVKGRSEETVEYVRPELGWTGTWPVTTTVAWELDFKRLARRPRDL